MSSRITEAEKKLYAEVQADPVAYQRLRDKARWEHMTLFAILREWGDPRKWDQ